MAAREYLDQYSDPQLPRYDAAKRRELFLKRYKDLLNAVIHGVVYLHLEPLVHVVLTLDSILVDVSADNRDRTLKLTHLDHKP